MEFNLEGFYENKIFRILNIINIFIALCLFFFTNNRISIIFILLFFSFIRTVSNKRVDIIFKNNNLKIENEKIEQYLSNKKINSYFFYRNVPGLTKNKKELISNMNEEDIPCKCKISYSKGTLTINDIEYLEFQFLNYYMQSKKN